MQSRLGGDRAFRLPHTGRRIAVRLGLGAASTALIAGGIVGLGATGIAKADSGPTQGSAYAQSLQITPHEGSLAVGAILGESLAGNTGGFARAQSQGVDLGAVGVTMKGYNCGSPANPIVAGLVPDPLETETGASGAAQGQTQQPSKADYGATEYVLANDTPYGEADTTFAGPLAAPTSALAVSGLHTSTWSGLHNGVTGSGASSTIASLSIGGGMVQLQGLDWEAEYPTGSSAQPTGSFTIGQVLIAGKSIPPTDLTAVDAAVNKVLSLVGIELLLPQVSVQQGTLYVSPLDLEVVPNTTRDGLIDPILNAAGPLYFQLASGLENGFTSDKPPLSSLGTLEQSSAGQKLAAALCQSDTPITVADVTLAAFDGGGYFSASLGGVNATSGPLSTNDFNLTPLGSGFSLPSSTQYIPGTAGTLGTSGSFTPSSPSTLGGLETTPTTAPTTTPTTTAPTPQVPVRESLGARPAGYVSGGPLLAAGLGGLALLLLLIEGDRRMMRRLQRRTAPLED